MSKVVLITGASSGIGKVSAEYLSNKGYIVYGTSRKINSNHVPFTMIQLDLRSRDSIEKAVSIVLENEKRIDVLINNAGIGITGSIEETPTDEVRKSFDTNFFGVLDIIKIVLPHMRQQKTGMVINITSLAGYMGLPFRGIYSSIKGALELITESLRMEVKEFGIKITNIAPGDYATNIESGRYHFPVNQDSPYKNAYQRNLELMNDHVDQGRDPIEIAKKIEKIINNNEPKIHYRVGDGLQKLSIFLKRILPDKVYEKLIMKYYKM